MAEATGTALESVEWILMRAMSNGLIKGVIDGVEGKVHVSWIMPRVLLPEQVEQMRKGLERWSESVGETLKEVRSATPEFAS